MQVLETASTGQVNKDWFVNGLKLPKELIIKIQVKYLKCIMDLVSIDVLIWHNLQTIFLWQTQLNLGVSWILSIHKQPVRMIYLVDY